MLDIPMFTTDLGVASLVLSQIPYTGQAYVRIQSTQQPLKFIEECISFCKAAGADEVFGAGHPFLQSYPFHTSILRMTVNTLPVVDTCLCPVQEDTTEHWREIYNERMRSVPNAAWLTKGKLKELLATGSAYFVYKDGNLIGIGLVSGNEITVIIATQKGMGYFVLCSLRGVITSDVVEVEVASTNIPAIKLYKRVGFVVSEELSRWYKIF